MIFALNRVLTIKFSCWIATALLLPMSAMAAAEIVIEQPAGTPLVANAVVGFGSNSDGQINVPPSLTGVIAIAANENYSAALQLDGTVVGWGQYAGGANMLPAGLNGVAAISAGGFHINALKSDNSVVSSPGIAAIPAGLPNIAVAAGSGWSVALKNNGSVLMWGQNAPPNPGLPALTKVAAGEFHALGLTSIGSVQAWGNNSDGQTVVPIGASFAVQAIAAGKRFSLALKTNGTVLGWGFNDNGGGAATPVPAGLNGVVAISANGHALALKADGSVVGWGRGVEGQLSLPAGVTAVRQLAAGGLHSLVLVGTPVSYPNTLVGAPGLAKTFTLKNTGPDALSVSSVGALGVNASEFVVSTAGMLASVPAGGQTSFSVSFTPNAAGLRRTTLRVLNSDSDEARFDILLSGTGYTAPEIAISGNSLLINDGDGSPSLLDHTDFSEVLLGQSVLRSYSISNSGSAPLLLGAVSFGEEHAADFSVSAAVPSTIAPGQSGTLQIRFTPSATGLRRASLIVSSNDFDEDPYDFVIQGTATDPEIALSSLDEEIGDGTAAAVDFGGTDINNTTILRSFHVSNIGSAALGLGSINITGAHAADFVVVTAPPASIAAGASADFQVRFDPSELGTRNASLSFSNTDQDENPFNFPLAGAGYAVEIAISGNAINISDGDLTPSLLDHTDFGTTPRNSGEVLGSFLIRNLGAGAVNLALGALTISGPNAADFSLRMPAQAILAPGASTTLQIAFNPSGVSVRRATLSLANNDTDENPFDFAIQGSGLAAEIAIELSGNVLISGGVQAWANNELGQTNVPAGLEGVVELAGGFSNTLARKRDGTLVAWGRNDYGQSAVPAGLRGVIAIAASRFHSLALKADGTVVAWGRNTSGQCNVAGISNVVAIAAGDEQTFLARSDGRVLALGANSFGQIDVPASVTSVTQLAAGWGHTLALKSDGTVVAWGRNVDGQTNVPLGLTGVVQIRAGFHNSYARKSDGTILSWGENDHGEASLAAVLTNIVDFNPGAHHVLARNALGSLFAWGWNDSGQSTIPTPIAPTGDAPVLAMAGGEKHSVIATDAFAAFAANETGSGFAKTFTIKNLGPSPLTISNISLLGVNAADFTLNTSSTLMSLPASIGQTTFSVYFNATSGDVRHARVRVLSDDADEGQFDIGLVGRTAVEIAVSGNGVNIANGDVTPSRADHTDFGSVFINGGALIRTFSIRNDGPGALHVGAITVSGAAAGDFTVTQQPAAIISSGTSSNFQVRFDPSVCALCEARVGIASDDLDENPFTFDVIGMGAVVTRGDLDALDAQITGLEVRATAVQADGKILIGGTFSAVQGVPRNNLARLLPSGALDLSYDPNPNGPVNSIVVMAEGEVLIGGNFSALAAGGGNTLARGSVAKLHADGSLDLSFDPNVAGSVYGLFSQPDGRILIAGEFASLQPNAAASASDRPNLARVFADGSVDAAFNPRPNGAVYSVARQRDGKFVLGGAFTALAPNATAVVSRGRVARILADGTLDLNFDPQANGPVYAVAISAGEQIYVGGAFTNLQPNGAVVVQRAYLSRINPGGALDPNYNTVVNAAVRSISVDSVFTITIGGDFSSVQVAGASAPIARSRVAQVQSSGAIVLDFDPNIDPSFGGAGASVLSVALQANGQVLLGGRFSQLTPNGTANASPRNLFARLVNNYTSFELSIEQGGTLILWKHLGSVPYVSQVSFDLSLDAGTTWQPLDTPEYYPGISAWLLSGPALPSNPTLRARGLISGGSGNASSGRIQVVRAFSNLQLPQLAFLGNEIVIANGDNTPRLDNYSDFGAVATSSGTLERVYSVRNLGPGSLILNSVNVIGAHAGDFSVITQPAAIVVAGAGTSVRLRFDPSASGLRSARLRFTSNDFYATPFEISIQGTGQASAPTAINLSSNSLPENNAIDAVVGTLSAVAPDQGSYAFTLVSGAGDDDNARFNIIGSTLLLLERANFEVKNSYSLRVQADNGGAGIVARPLIVNISNINELPSFVKGAHLSIAASSSPQTLPNWASAIDDGDSTVTQVLSFNVSNNNAALFTSAPMLSSDGTLSFIPSGVSGSAILNVSLSDDASINSTPALTSSVQSVSIFVGVTAAADLSISKTNARNFVNGAAPVDYLITVSNPSAIPVLGARVQDAIGAGTDFTSAEWRCTPLNNASCPNPANGSGALDMLIDLPASSSMQFLFAALPFTGVETTISNIASVTPPAHISDSNLTNNVASDGPDVRGIFRGGFE